ncbi:uncharacterized protein VTP21DRAFT_5995 [Calcarisporiella thermophila]|uniref:uncharacterized protein n=1 Tax=Calcarisporiella thermophila TaxID=911321 RepID=UPI0037421B26
MMQLDRMLFGLTPGLTQSTSIRPIWNRPWAKSIEFKRFPGLYFSQDDHLGILIEKMSSLCVGESVKKSFPRFVERAVKIEQSASLFARRDPLKSINMSLGISLIDEWFYKHINPQPLVLNRTITIKEYCEQRIDPFLYATLFGKILAVNEDERTRLNGEILIDYAFSILETEPYRATLSRLQGLYILAGHMNYLGDSKKCSALNRLALRVAKDLRIPEQDSSEFNEILDPAERELRNNIWWALRSVFTWEAFHLGNSIDMELITAPIQLPVKSEKESVLFALDQNNGYTLFQQEHAHMIRTSFNFACLNVFLAEVWQCITSTLSTTSNLATNELTSVNEAIQPHHPISLLSSLLTRSLTDYTVNLDPEYAAEQLLYLYTLMIHVHFLKPHHDSPISLNISTVIHCTFYANAVVNLAEIVLEDPESLPAQPVVAFGLNTCVFLYSLVLKAKIRTLRDEALLNLNRILQFFRTKIVVFKEEDSMKTIENILADAELSSLEELNESSTIIPIMAPAVSLRPLSPVESRNKDASPLSTVPIFLVRDITAPEAEEELSRPSLAWSDSLEPQRGSSDGSIGLDDIALDYLLQPLQLDII